MERYYRSEASKARSNQLKKAGYKENHYTSSDPVFSEPVNGPLWLRIPVTIAAYFLMLMLIAKVLGVIFSWLNT